MELPPRARRILGTNVNTLRKQGTTSACAENTKSDLDLKIARLELPPRARRIRVDLFGQHAICGTTSAYAENTVPPWLTTRSAWNYLRVRGEYIWSGPNNITSLELPPRTRRIPLEPGYKMAVRGTTSAYAENTLPLPAAR